MKTDMESIAGSPAKAPAALSETPPLRPHEGIAIANAPNQVSPIGRISLWLAIGGLVVPIFLALIGALLAEVIHPPVAYFTLCVVLLFLLEFAALVCGVAGRRTTSGKAGVAVSLIWLVFGGCGGMSIFLWAFTTSTSTTTAKRIKNSPPTVQETLIPAQSPWPAAVQPKTTSAPAMPPIQKPPAANTGTHPSPRMVENGSP